MKTDRLVPKICQECFEVPCECESEQVELTEYMEIEEGLEILQKQYDKLREQTIIKILKELKESAIIIMDSQDWIERFFVRLDDVEKILRKEIK